MKIFVSITLLALTSVIGIESLVGDRIVGGTKTDISLHKHLVALYKKGSFFCGGSIITPKCILTAAHCTAEVPAIDILVRGGFTEHLEKKGVVRKVSKIFNPRKYHPDTYDMDVSIMILDNEISGPDISTIKMCSKSIPAGTVLKIAGWGDTDEKESIPKSLMQTIVHSISRNDCRKKYGYKPEEIRDSMICGVTPKGSSITDACTGDSGGPAVVDGKLCGIVSWGTGCGRLYFPGVYTEIPYVRPWIDTIVAAHCN